MTETEADWRPHVVVRQGESVGGRRRGMREKKRPESGWNCFWRCSGGRLMMQVSSRNGVLLAGARGWMAVVVRLARSGRPQGAVGDGGEKKKRGTRVRYRRRGEYGDERNRVPSRRDYPGLRIGTAAGRGEEAGLAASFWWELMMDWEGRRGREENWSLGRGCLVEEGHAPLADATPLTHENGRERAG